MPTKNCIRLVYSHHIVMLSSLKSLVLRSTKEQDGNSLALDFQSLNSSANTDVSRTAESELFVGQTYISLRLGNVISVLRETNKADSLSTVARRGIYQFEHTFITSEQSSCVYNILCTKRWILGV